jgi:hypothetical protein
MAETSIANFMIPCDLAGFVNLFWRDKKWFEKFLADQVGDIDIEIGDWMEDNADNSGRRSREIRSFHPSRISFPGLPAHCESRKTQILEFFLQDKLFVKEENTFDGIPYSDYFNVNVDWTCMSVEGGCHVEIEVSFIFHKSTWLQGTIEANTLAELRDLYALWHETAMETIHSTRLAAAARSIDWDVEQPKPKNELILGAESESENENEPVGSEVESEVEVLSDRKSQTKASILGRLDKNFKFILDNVTDATDDDEYFDCEEGTPRTMNDHMTATAPMNTHARSPMRLQKHQMYTGRGHCNGYGSSESIFTADQLPTPMGKIRRNSTSRISFMSFSEGESEEDGDQIRSPKPVTVREGAIICVETLFVLYEFSYWKLYGLYQYELKEDFKITPREVMDRIMNSVIPGRHSKLLEKPDLYGPLMATAFLPQILLLCMEVKDGGCSRASILGSTVVTSFCLWLGLASLYSLVAILLAPAISFKQTLCMTGYSFYPWMVAILTSYTLEQLESNYWMHVTPLILFGLPSSVALGLLFWEYTPQSSVTMRVNSCPQRLQWCAQRNLDLLQRLLHALPKIIAFVFVVATHYQFLWFLARVFLPGRKQMCRLTAILQPAAYADILTQKELIRYAYALLASESEN